MGRYDVMTAELADAAARRSDHSFFLPPHVFVKTDATECESEREADRQANADANVRQMHAYDDDGTSRKKNMTSDAANAAVNDANAAPRMTHKPKPHLARSGYT